MDKSDSQKQIKSKTINEDPEQLNASLSDTKLTIIIQAGGHEAAYTADEAREFASGLLSAYHQRGWGRDIVPTADFICDLANVLDNDISAEDVKKKWEHDGEFGSGKQYTIVTDAGSDEIMSFDSKLEAMQFCEDWNNRSTWTIEYHLENDGERVAIWNLTESGGELVAERMEKEIKHLICSEDVPDWEISVEFKIEIPSKEGPERSIFVGIRNPEHQRERYRYELYYSFDGKGINTLTQKPVTHKSRVRIDRQRGRILEPMSKIPKQFGLHFGPPDADLEWLNLGPVLSPDHDFP